MSLRDAFNLAQGADPLPAFLISDLDEASGYYGYCSLNGAWLIKFIDLAAGTVRYVGGSSDYPTAWTNRASLTYNLPFNA